MAPEGSASNPNAIARILPRRRFVSLLPLDVPGGWIESEFHMDIQIRMRSLTRKRRCRLLSGATPCVLVPWMAAAQALTGALVRTVKHEQGAVLPGALVRVTSPGMLG